ncbi:hypothetical protein [Alicyclobacillus kakegawensis]|uniref:hypothetical protein n=1 Tax=Alicyclobacillus kakegawensis TaxID=392012 RepID=UPI000832179E|nr:hypothetical protein [Alicyclobacillus kakegawensis]
MHDRTKDMELQIGGTKIRVVAPQISEEERKRREQAVAMAVYRCVERRLCRNNSEGDVDVAGSDVYRR